jgi:hypothetical protein
MKCFEKCKKMGGNKKLLLYYDLLLQGTLTETINLSTFGLLIKAACFVKKTK